MLIVGDKAVAKIAQIVDRVECFEVLRQAAD